MDVSQWINELESDLYGRTLPFWLAYSVDSKNGGFFNCLDEDGGVTDTTKHVWLQGRQSWMLARVAREHTDDELLALAERHRTDMPRPSRSKADVQPLALTRANLIKAAKAGVEFLKSHAVRADGQIYFALTEDGRPVTMQRKPFSALFMVMALNEVGAVTGSEELQQEARELTERVLGWSRTPGSLREVCEGAPSLSPLNLPMILLSVYSELEGSALPAPAQQPRDYTAEKQWAVDEIIKHIHPVSGNMLENVQPDGVFDFSLSEGRLHNPGHAIEAGWFLLEHGRKCGDAALKETALEIIHQNFKAGWDATNESGGITYFLDAEGYTPQQLEHNMKLWWPLCEAMVAFSMAYEETLSADFLDGFHKAASWAYGHLVDKKHGEWFGYADRAGSVTHRFKGGAYKGCFHVPRALFMSRKSLISALKKQA